MKPVPKMDEIQDCHEDLNILLTNLKRNIITIIGNSEAVRTDTSFCNRGRFERLEKYENVP